MKKESFFSFGEKNSDFDIKVFNEREIRASAGILFLWAGISFMNSWLMGIFYYTRVFVVVFLIDFFIRLFINPKYSPSIILGKFIVRKQKPEYVGAVQKRFAWGFGFGLALIMFILIVVNNVTGPINLLVCFICLLLLFFESVFGICIGCNVYNLFGKNKAKMCPGESCDIKKTDYLKISQLQIFIVLLFTILVIIIYKTDLIKMDKFSYNDMNNVDISKCYVPIWAKKIGHDKKYILHHGCKKIEKKIKKSKENLTSDSDSKNINKIDITKCYIPDFAKEMGHEEKYVRLHGCKKIK